MKTHFCFAALVLLLVCADARALLEKRELAPSTPSGQAAAGSWGPGLKCLGWRKTLTCDPSGPRDPINDKDCLTIIASQESGFCECEGYVQTAAVPCGHNPVNCTKECGIMQKLHREKFSPGSKWGAADDEEEQEDAMDKLANNKDPYTSAQLYGQQAVSNVNRAVNEIGSNSLLKSSRGLISKLKNLKPWSEMAELGKVAETAGKKTQDLSKLARPFIYSLLDPSDIRHARAMYSLLDSSSADGSSGQSGYSWDASDANSNLRGAPRDTSGVMNMLLKSSVGVETKEFAEGCVRVTQAIVAENDGRKQTVASQLSLICSGLQLPLDADICQRYRSTLLSHLHTEAQRNMVDVDYTHFCSDMSKVAAEQKAEVVAQIASMKAKADAQEAKETAVAEELAAKRSHWPAKKTATDKAAPNGLQLVQATNDRIHKDRIQLAAIDRILQDPILT